MAFTEALRLIVEADTKGAVAGIERLGSTADRELSKSEKNLDRWGNRLTKAGTGLLTFGAVAATGLAMAAQSAGELEQAVGGTTAVFGDAAKKIDDYAEHSAESVGLSQTAFRDLTTVAGAQLKNLGFSTDEAADKAIYLTEIGADLAATYGGTTKEAVEALGAAFRGEADPAERFGLSLNQTAVNAKAVELGLAASTSEVDSAAKAQATLALITEQTADAQGQFARESDTLAGQQQRTAAAFEDLKAEIGAGAIPAMKTLVGVAGDVTDAFSGLNDATGGAVGKVATFATVGAIATGGLSLVVGQAIKMRDTFVAARDGTQALVGKLGGLKSAAALAAGAAGIAGLIIMAKQLGDEANRIDVDSLAESLNSTNDSAREGTKEIIRTAVAFDRLDSTFAKLLDTSVPAAEEFIRQAIALGVEEDAVDQLRAALEEKKAADVGGAAASSEYSGEVDEAAGALTGQKNATEDATTALEEYSDALQAQFDPLFGAIDATRDLADANANVTAKEMELAAAIDEHGASSVEAMTAQQELTDAQLAASGAAVDQQGALADLRVAVEDGTTSLASAKDQLALWVAQGLITQESADETARHLDGVTWAAGGIPDDITTTVQARTATAMLLLDQVWGGLLNLDGKTATVNVRANVDYDVPVYQTFGGGRELGGPVRAGSVYEVTEGGKPELLEQGGRTYLLPGADGQVTPIGAASGGGAGMGTVINNVYLSGIVASNESDIERVVVGALNSAMRKGVSVNVRGRAL